MGDRYRLRSLLGAGGMGDVWHALDLKLRVDVALKALRPELLEEERARALLRREVRSAREVISPNVCRVFDLEELDGQELLAMEYIDGQTLVERLRSHSPLPLEEAREIAAQFLAGLEAIHQAGLVHRDVKPENVMLTPAGRVVVMDFGIARALEEGRSQTVAGTPAYMSPEQARGEVVDARADLFSAGVVLQEMIAPAGVSTREAREAVWRAMRQEPMQLPESPWRAVLERAVARSPEQRHASASALARALEDVTMRVEGAEELQPYPGLGSFSEEDAEYFFGRELEVEALWRRLRRTHLLAVIGPSGAGKSSFLRAGLLPVMPEGWRAVVAAPGDRPFAELGKALAPELEGDSEAIAQLVSFEEPDVAVELFARWRRRHRHALVVLDQFEELFTQNEPSRRQRFAALLGRLALEADVHILLSMRDDFLLECQRHEALAPIFSEMTPLNQLMGSGLRRALVQPALKCGYRFEDDHLVDEMVAEIAGERGALPLLAFAAARLWQFRDREKGVLTREAYEHVGGVAGALAHHAEETMERIGAEHAPIVRELFRNLVTAQGTRAARERGDLLSVFDEAERQAAGEVLDTLIDARLLTSYEQPGIESQSTRTRIEIIHESLLANWPRLVRWHSQDEDSALLRDQLRQAAQMWEQRCQPDDLLWTGTSFREYELWRERYEGGLSEGEERFARAMTSRARHRKRQRRMATVAAFALLLLVLGAVTVLWGRSERARLEAEAAELVSAGRLRLEGHPTAALAYALASLERADNVAARRFSVEALWRGPMVSVVTSSAAVGGWLPTWSPDGRWLAMRGQSGIVVQDRESTEIHELPQEIEAHVVGFSPDSSRLVTREFSGEMEAQPYGDLHVWSLPGGERLQTWRIPGLRTAVLGEERILTREREVPEQPGGIVFWKRSIEGGPARMLGRETPVMQCCGTFGPKGEWVFASEKGRLLRWRLDALDEPPDLLGQFDGERGVNRWGDRIVTSHENGERRVRDPATGRLEQTLRPPTLPREMREKWGQLQVVAVDPASRFFAAAPGSGGTGLPPGSFQVVDLASPRGAEPVRLLNDELDRLNGAAFHPSVPLLASGHHSDDIQLWNLAGPRSRVFLGGAGGLAFTPEGRLLTTTGDEVRLLPPWGDSEAAAETVWSEPEVGGREGLNGLVVSADGRFAFALNGNANGGDVVFLVPLDGSPAVRYHVGGNVPPGAVEQVGSPSFGPEGRRVAMAYGAIGVPEAASVRVLDLETGEVRVLRPADTTNACVSLRADIGPMQSPFWMADGRLISTGALGLRLWDLADGTSRQLQPCRDGAPSVAATPDGRTALVVTDPHGFELSGRSLLIAVDLDTGASRELASHGNRVSSFAVDRTGTAVVTGDRDGVVRAAPLEGGEPYLFYGHERVVTHVAVSPDGRWIASADADSVRLWPMPDFADPPLQTLPHDELLDRLRRLTNLRVVEDPESASGFTLEPAHFPGWGEVLSWYRARK